MPKNIARLLGLGAYAAAAGIVGLYLLLVYATRHTVSSGLDATEAHVTWLAVGGVVAALLIAHHVLGRELLALARSGGAPQSLGAK